MSALRAKLTYANVMSSLAVFLVLGGGAYAAATLPKNSVGTRQLRRGAVTAAKVRKGSLLASNFKPGQLPAGIAGPAGTTGPAGPAGAPGQQGAAGTALGYAFIKFDATVVAELSKNVQGMSVTKGPLSIAGVYCISGLPFTPASVTATISALNPGSAVGVLTAVRADSPALFNADCGSTAQALVTTMTSAGAPTAASFFVTFN